MHSSYDKRPAVQIKGWIINGWPEILEFLASEMQERRTLIVDCYTGVYYEELTGKLSSLQGYRLLDTRRLLKSEQEIRQLTADTLTEDPLFGHITRLSFEDYFDKEKVLAAQQDIITSKEKTIVFGYGASLITQAGLVVFADMPRWEIQLRMRLGKVDGIGVSNHDEPISIQYKRGYFNDWKILDQHKQTLFHRADFWLDTTEMTHPKLINKETFLNGLAKVSASPFRVVPFFDPAPWGGQWMKEIFDLDRSKINYGWCFDCVPEENSLILKINDTAFEMPAINLVYFKTRELLGEAIESRFGKEFPIRFDFLDTMDGGNLSLQVHPTLAFAREQFGLAYTQDESYYIVDAKEGASVYLGLKTGIDQAQMLTELEEANSEPEKEFNADKYVNKIPAKKHDHFLIPAGTIHCSGQNTVVLEISATPNLFTFKLWDWNRPGLDGKPRPVNIERGKQVLQWDRDTAITVGKLGNKFEIISEGEGWREERTGLHPTEFIETRRHYFTGQINHQTDNTVNVLNLVEGAEIIVESPDSSFEPFVVHYAETFIIPASIKEYSIRPHGSSEGKECITIKAYVRN